MEQTLLQAFQSASILSWMNWQCRHALKRHNSECNSCITLQLEENSFPCSVVAAAAATIQFDFQSFIFYIHLGIKYLFPHSLLHSGTEGFNSITFLIISVTLAAKFYHCISLTSAILITLSNWYFTCVYFILTFMTILIMFVRNCLLQTPSDDIKVEDITTRDKRSDW
jgi:magnesium-transporting ATPase (P-type)